MTIILGTFIVLLVLFMVLAMAAAEWADLDAGDLLARWLPGRRKTAAPSAAPAAVAETAHPEVAAPKPAARKKAASRPAAPVRAKRTVRPAAAKAKSSSSQRKRK